MPAADLSPDDWNRQGISFAQQGKLAEAAQCFQRAVSINPNFAGAHYNLGLVLQDQGQPEEALASFDRALHLSPANVLYHHSRGIVFKDLGKSSEATFCFRRTLELDPNFAAAHHDLGHVFKDLGNLAEAEACYRRALDTKPDFVEAHTNLGNVLLEKGQTVHAIACYRQALKIAPDFAVALVNLGAALKEPGQLDEAMDCFRRALHINPNLAEAYINLGAAYKKRGQPAEALYCFQQGLHINPHHAEAYDNLGLVLKDLGQLTEAMNCYRQALTINPQHVTAHGNLADAYKDQGLLAESIACYRKALELDPGCMIAHSNILYTLDFCPGVDPAAIFEESQRWYRRFAQPLAKFIKTHQNDRSPERRLRIGYVSPDFRTHAVGCNFAPLMRHHDHQQFDISLYAQLDRTDAMTEQLRSQADAWHPIAGMTDEQVADKIRQDGIDILVDLTLHMGGNRLLVFARKPAPVQVTFMGYPGTTGLHTIDYRLTDPYFDPPGLDDAWYSEESYRLPHSLGCYDPPSEEPPVGPLPALTNGFVTFGTLNNFCKINDGVLAVWARVLRAVPGSQLLLFAHKGTHRTRTLDFLVQQGVTAERVQFSSFMPFSEYLALYHQMDIGLDTFPYNGHTTSMDSFWMGVPVVTLVGDTVVGRGGLSQSSNLGLEELVARTPDHFVERAVTLASDLPKLQELRAGLRQRMKQSPLMDARGFARDVEQAYRYMWRKWCTQ